MALAYDNLAPHMRDMLGTLEAVHDLGCFRNDYLGKESNIQAMNEGVHSNGAWVHPVIGTHPITGDKYINVKLIHSAHCGHAQGRERPSARVPLLTHRST